MLLAPSSMTYPMQDRRPKSAGCCVLTPISDTSTSTMKSCCWACVLNLLPLLFATISSSRSQYMCAGINSVKSVGLRCASGQAGGENEYHRGTPQCIPQGNLPVMYLFLMFLFQLWDRFSQNFLNTVMKRRTKTKRANNSTPTWAQCMCWSSSHLLAEKNIVLWVLGDYSHPPFYTFMGI